MIATRFVSACAVLATAVAATAQTHAEMLEKGIFLEETVGNLDRAQRIYESLTVASSVPPAIAVTARSRLTDVRRRQQLAARMASVRTQLNPRADAPALAGTAAAAGGAAAAQQSAGTSGFFPDNYDAARPISVNGTIFRVEWSNPQIVIYVKGSDGNEWGFTVPSPNTMLLAGWNKTTLKLGEQVFVFGHLARGASDCPAPLPHACATLQQGALHASASTIIAGADGRTLYDAASVEQQARQRQLEQLRDGQGGASSVPGR